MKALTLVLCILALLGSGASGFFWWQIGDSKARLQSDLSAEQARATGLQSELGKKSEELETTNTRLLAESAELGDAKSKLTAAEANNVQISREVGMLKKSLAEKEKTEKELNTNLDALRRELVQTRLAAQVGSPEESERYKQTIASLENRLATLTGQPVSAETVTGTASGPVRSERTAAARVATVGTKNAFVVLDLGTADGVVAGNKFTITRAGETLAESVISEVQDTFAIAQIVPTSIKSALRAGDIASIHN